MLIELALRNLARTKVRSTLAVIGIIIGVMAISSIGIFGESLKGVVLENFRDVANEVIVTPDYTHGYTSIDERTLEKLERIPYAEVIPVKSDSALVSYKDKRTYVTVYGMDEEDIKMFKLEKGSYKGCLVGSSVAEYFKLRIGSKIEIKGKEFRVGGILRQEARFDVNPNFAVILSTKDFDRVFNKKNEYTMVIIKVKRLEDVERVKDYVKKVVNRKDSKVSVFEMKMILERIEEVFGQMTLFLMAIAGVSLLVAGISILNIMLMSTIERTKEIGLMRAIGAYRETILKIFLTEALILGLIGSIIGGALSFVGGYAIDMLILGTAKYVFQLSSLLYVFVGIGFGIITALVSALYPAWKASRLEPIQALRYE
jgi:putative ABC transport system permease protein